MPDINTAIFAEIPWPVADLLDCMPLLEAFLTATRP